MKRYGNLFDKVVSMENLELADHKARLGKKARYGIKIFDRKREENLRKLQKNLINGTYHTSKYTTFFVQDPKEREIFRLPYYPDRILHHAIMTVCEPIWTATFIRDTYSCIKDRGMFKCAERCIEFIKKYDAGKPLYCLKMDIKKYFPSVDHETLKKILRKSIKDKRLLDLLDEIVDSAPGIPIGNYLSQYFSNIYLTYFDHWLKEVKKVKHYLRYADDMVILSDDKEYLHNILKEIKEYLHEELKLTLKSNHQVFLVSFNKYDKHGHAIDFVGVKIYREQALIRNRIKKHFTKASAKINKNTDITADDYKRVSSAWLGWVKYTNSNNLAKKVIKSEHYKNLGKIFKYNRYKWFKTQKFIIMDGEYVTLESLGAFKENEGEKFFNCPLIPIDKVIGKQLLLIDYVTGVNTRQGDGRSIMKLRLLEGKHDFKVVTSSGKIRKTLEWLKDKSSETPIQVEIEQIQLKNKNMYSYQFVDSTNRSIADNDYTDEEKEIFG